nr:ubiquitin carboxyl-terminal hydrolase 16-like [Ipomoea batatas]
MGNSSALPIRIMFSFGEYWEQSWEAGVRTSCSSGRGRQVSLAYIWGLPFVHRIECMGCGGQSERHERIMDLTVEIAWDIAKLGRKF